MRRKPTPSKANRSLLLSREAEIDTKPQLEIFADDVKCTHGATIGQLDEDALFYLRARGIPEAEARDILVHAFASEVLERVKVEALRRQLEQELLASPRANADKPSRSTPMTSTTVAHDVCARFTGSFCAGDSDGQRTPHTSILKPCAPTFRFCNRQVHGKPLVYFDNARDDAKAASCD